MSSITMHSSILAPSRCEDGASHTKFIDNYSNISQNMDRPEGLSGLRLQTYKYKNPVTWTGNIEQPKVRSAHLPLSSTHIQPAFLSRASVLRSLQCLSPPTIQTRLSSALPNWNGSKPMGSDPPTETVRPCSVAVTLADPNSQRTSPMRTQKRRL